VQIKSGNGNGNGHGNAPDSTRSVNFDVVPIHMGTPNEPFFMILFEDVPEPVRMPTKKQRDAKRDETRIDKLEQELAATKEYLQSVIENQEATNEELQSANEEILSQRRAAKHERGARNG
jgi:two-component system CheB/CheR fusion protein